MATDRLWLSDGYYNMIYQLNPAYGSVLASFTFPGGEPAGLTWDGNHLFAIDKQNLMLLEMDTTGNLIDSASIASLGTDPEGLTFDGEYFWVTENTTDLIYQIDSGMTPVFSLAINPDPLVGGQTGTCIVTNGVLFLIIPVAGCRSSRG